MRKPRPTPTPKIEINEKEVTIGSTRRVSKVSEEQLLLPAIARAEEGRGAHADCVGLHRVTLAKQLPMEYAVELNRLIELEMEGSVG